MPALVASSWQNATGIVADVCRLAAALSIAAAALWYGPAEVARFVLVLVGLLVPRFAKVLRPFDAAYGITLLLAAWSGVAGWYAAVSWWDLAVHCVTTGAVAAMSYLVLARLVVVSDLQDERMPGRRHAIVVLTTALGFTVGVLWEFWEWAGNRYLNGSIHVGYTDSIADLAMDGAGSVVAGLALVAWSRAGWGTHLRDRRHPQGHDEDAGRRASRSRSA